MFERVNMSDFKSIDFGKADANKERGSSTLLLDGFFDNGYIDQILKGEKILRNRSKRLR